MWYTGVHSGTSLEIDGVSYATYYTWYLVMRVFIGRTICNETFIDGEEFCNY